VGLDSVELVLDVEEEFGIRIAEADAERLRSIRDVADYLQQRGIPAPRRQVVDKLRELAARLARVPIDQVSEESRFVEDLGFD
jgi:acyl carrier protein